MGQRAKITWSIVVLVLVATGILFLCRAPLARQLHDWKLLPQSETFSELYFSDSQHLPSMYRPADIQTVRFTLKSHEASPTIYPYTIIAKGTATTVLASGSLTLSPGASRTQQVSVHLPDGGPRLQVAVSLPAQHQEIHYWLTKKAAP